MPYDPDGGDAKGSTQHALARIVGIGERIGGPVPNSAEKRRQWVDGGGGALTGRGMKCQGEINNEGKAGSRSCGGAQCATCSGPLQQDCELITQQRGLQDA
ncbi:hypothetical protein KUCAC02_016028, partial [Chaenocephalus aceratus]